MSAHLSGCDQCGGPINGEQYCGDCMAYAAARIVSLEVQLQQVQADYGDLDHEVARLKMEMDVCGHAERIYEVTHLRGERDEYGALFLKACSEIAELINRDNDDKREELHLSRLTSATVAARFAAVQAAHLRGP